MPISRGFEKSKTVSDNFLYVFLFFYLDNIQIAILKCPMPEKCVSKTGILRYQNSHS